MTTPNPEKHSPGESSRRRGRRGLFRRVSRWWENSWLAERCYQLNNWFFNWWHPPADSSYPGYGYYYGRSRSTRLSRAVRRLRHLIRKLLPIKTTRALLWRLHDWWYPPSKDPYPNYAYYGQHRHSRLTLFRRRISHRLRHSVLGKKWQAAYERFYEWWYPVVDDPYPYYGYYGRKRKSRPVVLWRRWKRRLRESWLGKRYFEYSDRFYEWWYPRVQDSHGYYPYYGQRRVSRPVLLYRRWRRWFRNTWLGREFGWIVDEGEVLLGFVQIEVAQALSQRALQRFFSRKRNWAAVAALVALLVVGYKYGWPRYRHMVELKYARQAEQFLFKGDFSRAYLRIRQVMAINPDNSIAARVNAELADWAHSPFAVYWRQRTLLLAPNDTNRLALASTALRAEPFPYPTAAKTLGEISSDFQQTANYQMVAGALAIKLGRLAEAEEHYSKALKLKPDDPVARMSLAVVQLQSRDPKIVTDSRVTLELLNADGKLGILPLRSLVAESANGRDFARAEKLSDQILANPRATFGDRMLHLSILRAAGRTNFQAFLADTKQKALQHPALVGQLISWLNQSGYAADALKWGQELPRQVASQAMIPLALADSYVALGRWKELELYLDAERWIGQDHVRIALLALAMRQQSGNQGSALAWERAMRLASDAPTALDTLARMALNWGWVPEAEQVYWHAATKFPKQAWPLKALQNLSLSRRDTQGLLKVYQAMAERDPKDKLSRNNYTMVRLLSHKNLPDAHQAAAELYQAEAGNPVVASTYALSLYLQGKPAEGLKVLRALKPEALADPAVAVYYGVLLAAAGEATASKEYLEKCDKAFLLPEEMAMVNSARKIN